MPGRGELAIIMSGGGARAAYQIGFLRCLAHHYPDLPVAILSGVSAGAINAAYLAAHQGSFLDKVETLAEVGPSSLPTRSSGSIYPRWRGMSLAGVCG